MFGSIFGFGPKADIGQKLKEGAQVLDVRTPEEYRRGHVKGSVNIPLDRLQGRIAELDKSRPVVTCCMSGARSGRAASILKSAGFEAFNGGPWQHVDAQK